MKTCDCNEKRILHYFLGFPPYRSGGLTKYVMDLMEAQYEDGNVVMALWPGEMKILSRRVVIKQHATVDGILNYEVINPLPVPLDEGILDTKLYTRKSDIGIYLSFLEKSRPDVIHVHTLMGLHKELIDAAACLKIKTVFTTHDYFGLCPRTHFFRQNAACDDVDCRYCGNCNQNALPLYKIILLQSPLYRCVKNSALVRCLRKNHRQSFFEEDSRDVLGGGGDTRASQYLELRRYYISILEKIDIIHYNSSVSKKVYEKYITPKNSICMSITHKNVADRKHNIIWNTDEKIRLTYLSPTKPYKGYNVLVDALDELWEQGVCNFRLNVFSYVPDNREYMLVNEAGFKQDDLIDIFGNTDVLVAPSVWYETFGFTVLEAISFGVPVIVSDHVGAGDVTENGKIMVVAGDKESLIAAVKSLSHELILRMRNDIKKEPRVMEWHRFVELNYGLYM